jgi:hypothetical protein
MEQKLNNDVIIQQTVKTNQTTLRLGIRILPPEICDCEDVKRTRFGTYK